MITAGDIPRGDITMTPQQKAQSFALFLGKDLLAKMGFGDDAEDGLPYVLAKMFPSGEHQLTTSSINLRTAGRW